MSADLFIYQVKEIELFNDILSFVKSQVSLLIV